jgi:hypothetical protein
MKIKPNYFSVVITVILGVAIFKQFDFQNMKFEKPAIAIVYFIALIIGVGFMLKKSKK